MHCVEARRRNEEIQNSSSCSAVMRRQVQQRRTQRTRSVTRGFKTHPGLVLPGVTVVQIVK